jgi:hypothetical protein
MFFTEVTSSFFWEIAFTLVVLGTKKSQTIVFSAIFRPNIARKVGRL